jgi:uncharacterized membrane protein (DUF485 family)
VKADIVLKVKNNPKYHELLTKRNRFAWILSVLMILIYFSFILVIAFQPTLLANKISEGSIITVGIPIGVTIILSAFILTGIYVWRANGEFDELTKQIKEESK